MTACVSVCVCVCVCVCGLLVCSRGCEQPFTHINGNGCLCQVSDSGCLYWADEYSHDERKLGS